MAETIAPLTSTPAAALPPGSRVGEFEIVCVIETGQHGIVYAARERGGSASVAVKEFVPQAMVQRRGCTVSPLSARLAVLFVDGQRHFLRQARELSRVCHPSLAAPLRSWEQNGTAYVAMPLYRGQMLDRVSAGALAQPSRAWVESFVRPLLDLLGTLHRRGMYGVDLSPSNILLVDGKFPIVMRLGAPWNPLACGSMPPVPPQAPWPDIQALARLILPFVVGSHAYPDPLVDAVADAASGEPGRRASDVGTFMDTLGCHDRRRRVRSAAESVLSRAARVQATARPQTGQGAEPPSARAAAAPAALPAAELAAPIVVDAPPPAAPTPLTVTSATELSRGSPCVPSASPSRTVPVRWWAVLACCVVLTGATTWFVATRGDTDRAPLQPPSAPRAIATPPGLDNAVESLRPGPIAVDAPAPDVMPSPPPPAAPSVAPPLLTAASETPKAPDSRAASPQRPAALPIPPSRNTADPRCSDLLTRLSLGQDLNAADAALLERHCR